MSAAEIAQEIESLPQNERAETIRTLLKRLYPQNEKALERLLRRLEHPEIPEDVWAGFEEAEDGKLIPMMDEHFDNPPA